MAMANNRPGQRSRQRRTPIPEAERATEAIIQQGHAAQRELFTMIMTIGNLSKDERDMLFLAANKALAETVTSFGSQTFLLREKYKQKNTSAARTGNRVKATAWHDKARRLATDLWEKRSDFRRNASSTAAEIHDDLKKLCSGVGLKAPVAGTLAKYLSSLRS